MRLSAESLLADTEAGKDVAQQIIWQQFTRDFAQGLLSQAQFLGQQLSGQVFFKLLLAGREVAPCPV